MPTFIKTGYWKKQVDGLIGWLDLENWLVNDSNITSIQSDISGLQEDVSDSQENILDLQTRVGELEQVKWDDLRAPASGINPAGQVSPPSVSGDDGSLLFSTTEAVAIWFQLPHTWKEGTDLSPHIHWSKITSASGIVNWQIKYKWFNIGEVAPAFSSLTSGTEQVPNNDTADKHSLLSFPDIDGTGKTISSMLCIYLIRTDTDDTYGADAKLLEFDLHYQVDSHGSEEEYIK